MNGTYSVATLSPRTYSVHADLTNYTSQITSSITVFSDTTQTVNFALAPLPGAITGTVSDTVGPLSGATVNAIQNSSVVATATTSGSGTYTLASLNPGTYTVRASATDHGTVTYGSSVTVAANTTTPGINFTLPINPGTISGHVYDILAVGIPGATVIALQGSTQVASTTTDGSGYYTMPGLAPGSYTVEAMKATYQTNMTSATVTSSSVTTADLILQSLPGAIAGTVTNLLTSAPVANASISLYSGGTFLAATSTASDGTYSFSDIAPGSGYSITVTATHYATATVTGSPSLPRQPRRSTFH